MYYLPNPYDPNPALPARQARPFPSRGRETSRTSDCSSRCGGILPLEGELEGVYGRSYMIGVENSG